MSEYKEVEEIKQREKNEETLSDKLRDLLSNELLTDKLLKEKPKWLQVIGDNKPMSVIAGSLIAEAMAGDKSAASLVNKMAYGNNRQKSVVIVPKTSLSLLDSTLCLSQMDEIA